MSRSWIRWLAGSAYMEVGSSDAYGLLTCERGTRVRDWMEWSERLGVDGS